jgi:hypothetical protein
VFFSVRKSCLEQNGKKRHINGTLRGTMTRTSFLICTMGFAIGAFGAPAVAAAPEPITFTCKAVSVCASQLLL